MNANEPVRIAVFGAAGRMGRSMIRNLPDFPGLRLAAAVERPDCPDLGRDAGGLAGAPALGVPVSADADAAVAGCDVAVDFTFHAAVPEHAALARRHCKAFLVGTTALSPEERAAVLAVGQVAPVLIASNMSVGVNVLEALVRRAAAALGPGFDVEVVEMHHRHKKDAPSGTALSLARAAAEGRGLDLDAVARFGREGVSGERPPDEIAVHALRGGDVVGDHDVVFAADGEMVRLSHRATSRDCLSRGALRAAQWLAAQPAGVHSIAESLGL
ncbi:MAG: 4-hydroxy-tetrahydrodipicolinate reductase [Kiritimatiellae bacterium]|nr:4-hydroxy-tetrahydrodipicolinate reductase [Kiritimatiellia bacterium]